MSESEELPTELPLEGAGSRLRRAREALGLSRSDIAARTKVAERHLISIEEGRFSALASRTYAVGFARTYARAVGLDEGEIAQAVRDELGEAETGEDRRTVATFEPGDPARVPSARAAWIAALVVALVAIALWFLWPSMLRPAVSLPDLVPKETPAAVAASTVAAKTDGPAAQPTAGAVAFTALEDAIWVKFYDASGAQLMQKQMARGESYVVPAEANGPMIWTGRPEAFAVTVGGKAVPKLSDVQKTMKDVPVSAAALAARPPAAAASPAPAQTSTVSQ